MSRQATANRQRKGFANVYVIAPAVVFAALVVAGTVPRIVTHNSLEDIHARLVSEVPSVKATAVEQEDQTKSTAVEEAHAEAKPESQLPENSTSDVKPIEPVPSKRRAATQNISNGCQHYRTYDPTSKTYTGYDGQRHSCP